MPFVHTIVRMAARALESKRSRYEEAFGAGEAGEFEAARLRAEAARRSELEQEVLFLKAERDTARRIAAQYYALIEGILGEREVWKKMWMEDSAGHLNAQALLEQALSSARQAYNRVVVELNELRKEKGLPERGEMVPSDPPMGILAQSHARVVQQAKDAPQEKDGVAERDRIATAGAIDAAVELGAREENGG